MNMKAKMNTTTLQRYILIGASLGLYFGYFFRPQRDPNFAYALALAVIVTIGMFALRVLGMVPLFQRVKFLQASSMSFGDALRQVPINLIQYTAILAALELRHYAHDMGGWIATSILMTFLGALSGVWYWWRNPENKK